jgi:UDP-N-acetylmuramoyl-tripeptide--D-alanyl-D-alanine ligase
VRIVAVTGSVGKTTTKDLISEMLATQGPTLRTPGTNNGLDGVPATLLALAPHHRYAALELGIFSQPGEIAWLASLFRPTVAVLTSVHEDHLQYYGSRERIAREKRALLERVPPEGTAVVNADDELARRTAEGLACSVVLAGHAEDADFRILAARLEWPHGIGFTIATRDRQVEFRAPLLGKHFALSVALAAAAAQAVGVPLEVAAAAAARVRPGPNKMNIVAGPRGSTLLLDEFKSRMPGVRAALATLVEAPASRRIAVVGELQDRDLTPAGYAELAELLGNSVDLVVPVGRAAPILEGLLDETPVAPSARVEDAAAFLAHEIRKGDVVLVHGPTRQHLERIRMLLERQPVGCSVRRCVFHWHCPDCIYLDSGPPASCVELA